VEDALKSTDVYNQLKGELGPWFKAAGFKRGSGLLTWARRHGDWWTLAWCQVSQDGWDDFSGSKFTVEFARAEAAQAGANGPWRARLPRLLTAQERERVREIQNGIIAKLREPPRHHPMLTAGAAIRAAYARRFKRVAEPYTPGDDIWFRYANSADLSTWSVFILEKLPACTAQADHHG
jgi:hypothetical protein